MKLIYFLTIFTNLFVKLKINFNNIFGKCSKHLKLKFGGILYESKKSFAKS